MPMKTIEGYSKEKYTNTSVLLAGGGAKALSDFIGSLSWDSTNKKIKYTPIGGNTTDLVTLSWDNIANKPTSLPANGGDADTVDGYHASSFYKIKSLRSDVDSIYNLRWSYGGYDKGDYNGTYKDEYPTYYGTYLALTYNDKNSGALMFFDTPTSNALGHIYVRTRGAGDWNTTYSEWGTLAYLTDNVASATYASSAGNADTAERANYLSGHSSSPDNSHPGHGARVFYSWDIGSVGNATSGYSTGITIGSHPSDTGYGFQIVQNLWDDRTYTRRYNGGWQEWKTLAWTSDIPSVGNGTVTITQAGSTIGSFTMNQSDNTIIALNGTNTDYYPIRSYTSGLQISSYSGSTDCALFVPYATANQAGVVSTEDQTFSGEKTFSSIRLRSTDTVNFGGYLYFGDGSYTYLAELADDQLTLNATKIFLGISGSQKYYIDSTVFRPVTANSTSSSGIALGSSDYRFTCGYFSDKVYAYKGFYESSDERLKNILNPVKVNLDDLSKLRKVYYLWKDRTEDEIQLGMIAQDVQKLYPELVSVDKETGYLSLAYDKLSVLALEAIDVLYKEHKKLKKHVDELEKLLINNKIY